MVDESRPVDGISSSGVAPPPSLTLPSVVRHFKQFDWLSIGNLDFGPTLVFVADLVDFSGQREAFSSCF